MNFVLPRRLLFSNRVYHLEFGPETADATECMRYDYLPGQAFLAAVLPQCYNL
jgi:hypothetical protein